MNSMYGKWKQGNLKKINMYIHVPKDEKCPPRKLNNVCYPTSKILLMEFVEKKM